MKNHKTTSEHRRKAMLRQLEGGGRMPPLLRLGLAVVAAASAASAIASMSTM